MFILGDMVKRQLHLEKSSLIENSLLCVWGSSCTAQMSLPLWAYAWDVAANSALPCVCYSFSRFLGLLNFENCTSYYLPFLPMMISTFNEF